MASDLFFFRREKWIATLLVLVIVLVSGLSLWLHPGHDWGDDFAGYWLQSRALVHGEVANEISRNQKTIENSTALIGPVTYPWGLPLLMAPAVAFTENPLPLFLTLNIVFLLIFLAALDRLFRDEWSPRERLASLAFWGLNPVFTEFLRNALSDLPFLALTTVCLVLFKEGVTPERKTPWWKTIAAGFALAAAASLRSNAIVLLLLCLLTPVLMMGRAPFTSVAKRAGVALGLAVILSALLNGVLPRVESNHWALLQRADTYAPRHLVQNLWDKIKTPREFFEGVTHLHVLYALLLGPGLVAAFRALRKRELVAWHFWLNGPILLVWTGFGARMIFPIVPGLAQFGIRSLRWWQSRGRWSARVASGLVVLLFVNIAARQIRDVARGPAEPGGPFSPSAAEMFAFVREQTEPHATFTFFKPRAFRLMTDRDCWVKTQWDETLLSDYVAWSIGPGAENQLSAADLQRAVEGGRLREVFRNAQFVVFRVTSERAPAPSGG